MRCTLRSIRLLSFFVMAVLAFAEADSPSPILASGSAAIRPAMVIGFVGGFVKRNNSVHSTVQVAEHLRQRYPASVYVQAFENRHREQAYREVLRRLDLDHDGALSEDEKQAARIIIFGHSWGASETVTLARKLEREGIPVLLTIQVDSISKMGQDDAVIPGNVEEAVNFYQPHGLLHGRREIRAADPARTQILGNVRLDYKANPVSCKQYPWFDRVLMKSHIEIECDPKVWAQVESLIQLKLSPEARITAAK
jgi:pimeloyl-ACP methyl ester carboxylesterase